MDAAGAGGSGAAGDCAKAGAANAPANSAAVNRDTVRFIFLSFLPSWWPLNGPPPLTVNAIAVPSP